MSHSDGQVKFNDGTIMFYEYDGTSDIVMNHLWNTDEELHEHWRERPYPALECTCNNDEDVEIATDYGNGYWWKGRACKKCKAIVQGFGSGSIMTDEEYDNFEEFKELPKWWKINN